MATDPKLLHEPNPLDLAASQVIAACDGYAQAAIRSLIVATVGHF